MMNPALTRFGNTPQKTLLSDACFRLCQTYARKATRQK